MRGSSERAGLGPPPENRDGSSPVAKAIPQFPRPAPPMASATLAAAFPEVSGQTLDGTERTLPGDLTAPWTLLIVTFRDDLDPLADKWVMMGRRLAAGSDGRLDVFELPVVGKGWKVFRPLIHEAMKAQADDADEQARTMPVHQDRKRFRKRLGVRDDDTVHVFLVARDGRIAWHGEGLLTPETVSELERAVGETLSSEGPEAFRPAQEPDRATGHGLPGLHPPPENA